MRLRALTTALTFPVCSSMTSVVAGKPLVSSGELGTETTLMAVPMSDMREGMKRVVW